MKREERLNFIAKLITEHEIKTQEELSERLLEHEVYVTQATISRDIRSLNLIKLPAESGGLRYALPKNSEHGPQLLSQQSLFSRAILEIKELDNMISITAKPGMTSFIKNSLRERYDEQIFSILIDDDSVLILCNSEDSAQELSADLKNE